MTNDLPSVGTEDALKTADLLPAFEIAGLGRAVAADACNMLRSLAAERDELASRVRELEGLDARWSRVVKAAEHAHGPDAIRFKFSLRKNGTATNNFPKWLDGRWVSFVFAEDDAHIGYIAKALDAALASKEHP